MNTEKYQEFTSLLRQNLEQKPQVIGLVALGSMAQQDYMPDRWSDHDFFVITQTGQQENFRRELNWLPYADEIVIAVRETAHGLKVLYRNGHLLEFAVFDLQELQLAKVNRYRVLVDREETVAAPLEILGRQPASTDNAADLEAAEAKAFGVFLCNLLVGVGRHNRGEQLSGHQFVKVHALQHLVSLLAKYLASPQKELLDNLDALRRFERVFPEIGAELNLILLKETPLAARQLLAVAERELKDRLKNYPTEAVETVLQQFD